ncbi:DUF5658 family protein [Dehalobacterium formicoaceticum]|uniref:DUF5658 family protein n=1 Tax=Dehalobacterium formicoaceticum TaxID=51515 RepID=A0ABT1Y6N9_9FIRM|nr:DUF5658 family protein [Dehalobacterium formicoaceticum]MCR6545770.1 DUF5658 family protein [Dehalobacterium formicoaceticum]
MLSSRSKLNILLIIVAILNIIDLLASWQLISKYGLEMELNPIMRWVFGFGLVPTVLVKMGMLLLFLIVITLGARKYFRLAYMGTWVVILVMGAVTLVHVANSIIK